jgi:hypothetical protein
MTNHLEHITSMRLGRDGDVTLSFVDGRIVDAHLGHKVFGPSSAVASTTYLPKTSQLQLRTVRQDAITLELPAPDDLAPVHGRPTVYLDQNHWSTLSAAIHEPARVANESERRAAITIIEYASTGTLLLPMSSAHVSETCKQVDAGQRYKRALTIAQLSAGWQLRDPLHLRDLELRQALSDRYGGQRPTLAAAVTLEPNALHAVRTESLSDIGSEFPPDARWSIHVMRCAVGILDTLLDGEHIPMTMPARWKHEFQRFATFLRDNPTNVEMKRRRTHAKFIADLGTELSRAAYGVRVTPEQMSDWTLNHSAIDLRSMPALGLYREVLHEKLCDVNLRWQDNDLIDMMYLTAAAGYCNHVAAERSHASHIQNAIRRHGHGASVHRNLRSLVDHL